MHTAHDIERFFKSALNHPFPYEDCRWVAAHSNLNVEELIPDLDLYDSNIAGYASSATRLRSRSPEQLREGLRSLQKDFFSTFPSCAICRDSITPERTPQLHSRLETLETIRLALLPLFEQLTFATKGSQ
jgi:hypothetical protein